MASQMVVPASEDTLFMRGFSRRTGVDKIRDFFSKNGYECSVEFSKESDNDMLYIALKFAGRSVAKEVLNKYDDSDVLGDRITVSWFKDLRKAKQKHTSRSRYSPDDDYGRHSSRKHKRRFDDEDDFRRKRRSSSHSRSSSSRSPSPERKKKKSKSPKRKHRHSSVSRRSESIESDRYPVEKSKKKKKKDKKDHAPSDDERRSISKKHSRGGDKDEKVKPLYDPVDMDISEDDDKHKQRSPSPKAPVPQSRPRLYSDEVVDYPASPVQQRGVSYPEETRVVKQEARMMDGKGDNNPRRSKRRFEDMDTFRDRCAAEMAAEKRVRPEDAGFEQKMSSSFNGGMRDSDRGTLGLAPDKLMLVKDKKEEIERAYRQDCETFAAVTKMLVSKDPTLEDQLQRCLRDNLKEIGQRCILELKDSIEQIKSQSTGSMIV
ncbi:hypothetical protein CAPTEDRAFT_226845 [Capitella teleta]|uniref:Periphilin-1 C-terminal domain-containing protein n=1 Tax=Capitella teleta TaxID=283909 RepID=R7TVW7_CAPTE|nr:hypothetical protein CAPTEDRAFT_226845 [Capitella teleta]|eukprot:ELT95611.1 hypothetical protein CAPTEDRAFT_226845 [Capitella teleta]